MKKAIIIFMLGVLLSCNSHKRVEPFVAQRLQDNGVYPPELWTVVYDSCTFYWSKYDPITPEIDSIRIVRRKQAEDIIKALKGIDKEIESN